MKPAIGGLLVGLLALAMPQVLGTGYGWVQFGMDQRLLTLPLWVIVLLPFAKILTTGLSIGSGGAGGIFGPGMVIGGMVGAAFWRVAHDILPGMPAQPASFTIVAMMALFGGIAHAPLAVMLMVAEMTGNLSLLAPAMVAVGIATLLVGDRTIYRSQIGSRLDSPAHRYKYAFPLLATLTVADAMEPVTVTIGAGEPLATALERVQRAALTGRDVYPVCDAGGRPVGLLPIGIGTPAPDAGEERRVRVVMQPLPTLLDRAQPLDEAREALTIGGQAWAPVVEEHDGQLVGMVSAAGILQAYRAGLNQTIRRATTVTLGSLLFDVVVTPDSPLLGRPLRDMVLPDDALLITRRRDGVVITPSGDTDFRTGDVVTVVTTPPREHELRRFLAGA